MPQSNNTLFYDRDLLQTIVASQQGIDVNYDTKNVFGGYARAVEEQSADFLENYVQGNVVLEAGTEDLMQSFFTALKKSKYHRISSIVKKAEDKFKQNTIRQFKDNEKAKAFKDSHFKILNNKKEAARLSSRDMLLISSLLKENLGYSTTKLQNKLRSFAEEKIRKTLNGELPQDEDFIKLTESLGTYQQRQALHNKMNPKPVKEEISNISGLELNPRIVSLDQKDSLSATTLETKPEVSTPKKNRPSMKPKSSKTKNKKEKKFVSLWGNIWKWTKRTAVVAGLAALALLGGKFAKNQFNKSSDAPQKENTTVQAKTPVQTKVVEDTKTADFSKEMTALEKAYKNRFDTSLEIILGAQKRDQLYQKIDNLAKAGKIQYKDGTTREWYAHAFTMYNQLAPYSKENKVIKDLLAGKNIDKDYINSLVVKAERTGKGIKASGTYSAFDKAPKSLQQKHLKNRKAVKIAEKAATMAQTQQSR